MQKTVKKIFSAPSIRLNTLVMLEVVLLLLVSLGGLFYYTRKALIEESKKDADQRLNGVVQHIDNVLMGIEQTAGNMYYELLEHLDQPERMQPHCRRMVECNPNIIGCTIALEPNYYPDRELFVTFVHRKTYNSPEIITSDKFVGVPYTMQNWYTETMKTSSATWIVPDQNNKSLTEPVITFCLPIRDSNNECVGVMAVGLSINLLSQIVLEAKPSPNSYNVLLSHDGTYIIHPNHNKLLGQNVLTQPEVAESPTALVAAKEMLAGGTGNHSFIMNDFTWYLFFKPFLRNNVPGRSMEALNWSIATIYPKSDIFGEFDHLVLHILAIVAIGLLVFYMLCRIAIRGQLKPLIYLTESAERIADGHFDEPISETKRNDEVGVFQQQFMLMQKALEAKVEKQEQLTAKLSEHREELKKIYQQIQIDDRVKDTLLHNVTDRMIAPSTSILDSVTTLCDNYQEINRQEALKEIDNIKRQGDAILELLSHKFDAPSGSPAGANKEGKEDNHE